MQSKKATAWFQDLGSLPKKPTRLNPTCFSITIPPITLSPPVAWVIAHHPSYSLLQTSLMVLTIAGHHDFLCMTCSTHFPTSATLRRSSSLGKLLPSGNSQAGILSGFLWSAANYADVIELHNNSSFEVPSSTARDR